MSRVGFICNENGCGDCINFKSFYAFHDGEDDLEDEDSGICELSKDSVTWEDTCNNQKKYSK
ncbi:MAG TPA: hypothetical protein PLX69_25040 [Leptospiraceae bacterium]|nr:hypothetical protein [Leptospiraceae bacterium]HRG77850.1 hypothetical protein [Leptospiraceae bacterium]